MGFSARWSENPYPVWFLKIAISDLKKPLFTTKNQAFPGHLAGFYSYLGSMPSINKKRMVILQLQG